MSSLHPSVSQQSIAAEAFESVALAIAESRIPGAVLGIVDHSGERTVLADGHAQLIPDIRPMTTDTWFDLASLTKVIFTTPRILGLVDQGVLDLDSPISSVLKDFRQYQADCWERQVTFRQCLGHQTPFPAVEPLYTYGRDPELLRAFVLQREWKKGPSVYSDINFILLGLALERITGVPIREMDCGSGFGFSALPQNCAATEDCTWRHRVMCGEVHDDNCFALQGAGHAGLFGTVTSVLDFAEGLIHGVGASENSIKLMREPLSAQRTHGWLRAYQGWSGGDLCSEQTIGHTGFTGTGLWINFETRRAWTLLTNRVHPTRHSASGIDSLRRTVGDVINQ